MRTGSPVAMGGPQSDLDSLAYGQPYASAPPSQVADANGGGAISALRKALAAAPRGYAPQSRPVATAAAYDAYAAAPASVRYEAGYKLDAGDKLRVVVYGQEGLTNTYAIDAGGSITMPLIGAVSARGRNPASLAAEISAKLRNGYIREPSVAVEIESYRPFFILGEVTTAGQYAYVNGLRVESAVAVAGGFSPRALKSGASVARIIDGRTIHAYVPLSYPLRPGDTITVEERWL